MTPLHWQLLAVDLDSTLIGKDHKVHARDAEALQRARDAGVHVAICTGRNLIESAGVIGALDLAGLGVFTNGGTVAEMAAGLHVHARCIEPAMADRIIDCLGSLGHAVLALIDHPATRRPYYVRTQHAEPHRATVEWLIANQMQAAVHDEILPEFVAHIVRLGIVVNVEDSPAIEETLTRRFGDRITHHSIYSKHYDCQVIETFAPNVNKWTGIVDLCRIAGLDASRVIAIGDDVNDIAMLEHASLSFAVANAPAHIRARAKRVTAGQEDCGVAEVVDGMLRREF